MISTPSRLAFADGSYARAVVESIRMKYAEIITAWVECQHGALNAA